MLAQLAEFWSGLISTHFQATFKSGNVTEAAAACDATVSIGNAIFKRLEVAYTHA